MANKVTQYAKELFYNVIAYALVDLIYAILLVLVLTGLFYSAIYAWGISAPVSLHVVLMAGMTLLIVYIGAVLITSGKYYSLFKKKHLGRLEKSTDEA